MVSWRRIAESNGPARQPAFHRQLDGERSGESEALSTLYRQFLPAIFGYIATRVPDRATAEDLTSEVFLKMVEGIGQLRVSDEPGFACGGYFITSVLKMSDVALHSACAPSSSMHR